MTDNPSVPGPRRDMAIHTDRWTSGREHAPPCQNLPRPLLIATASRPGCTGPLDDLLTADTERTERLGKTRMPTRTAPLVSTRTKPPGHPSGRLTGGSHHCGPPARPPTATGQDTGGVRTARTHLLQPGDAQDQRGQHPAGTRRGVTSLTCKQRYVWIIDHYTLP
ncbi:hypothetical protein OG279_36525 [Streptomyces sp. NBC_01201]|uniref:hypothetical protein n=1 Tax=Streptomyces sp. NBC_01201 TaxID=2903770 RepID=UPI002E117999|nr:hypothetical protein OG279_36525 [Streptomyces sp. NBC_01201]